MKQCKVLKIENIQQILQKRGIRFELLEYGIKLLPDHAEIPNAVSEFYIINPEMNLEELLERLSLDHSVHKTEQTVIFGCTNNDYSCYAKITLKENAKNKQTKKDQPENNQALNDQPHKNGAKSIIEELRGVDSKMFRQAMDQLGLPRSGNLRLALTRIFRESMDSDGLMATMADEADRIVGTGEQDIVKGLQKMKQVPFITQILHLLWETIVSRHSIT